jgi:cyanophycin synthetase
MTKKQGVYNVVFRFADEIAGIYAGKLALNFINSVLQKNDFELKEGIENLVFIREKQLLGYSTQKIVEEANERRIPAIRLDKYNLVQLGTGKFKQIIRATITGNTSLIAVETSDNKFLTTQILKEAGVPIPNRILTNDINEVLAFHQKLQKSIVIKPAVGYQGKRISVNLNKTDTIKNAFEFANEFDDEIIAQEFIEGNTYRLLVIDNKFVAAVQLVAPHIVGDGINNLKTLFNRLNSHPDREFGDKSKLSKIEIDEDTLKILELENYTFDSILENGEIFYLKNSCNMRLGGSSVDLTDLVHPYNIFLAERISKILNLNVAGVDIITIDISKPIIDNNGKLIEVNAAPDFRMHIQPTLGKARQVQKPFVEMLFPENKHFRIPIFSITGSNGRNIFMEIFGTFLQKKYPKLGIASSKGLFINNNCLSKENPIDSHNTEIILKDPTVDAVLIETSVETILEYGIAYKFADIGIVLNIDESIEKYYEYDHIRDAEDVAYAKSVVAEEVYTEGFTILNADDKLVLEMRERLYSQLILFTQKADNAEIKKLVDSGGIACILTEGKVWILHANEKIEIIEIEKVPIIIKKCNIDALLASVAAMYVLKTPVEEIRSSLIL